MKTDNFQVTNQGATKIKVMFKDKLHDNVFWHKEVTRAFLAKMYHEQRVIGVIRMIPIIEV